MGVSQRSLPGLLDNTRNAFTLVEIALALGIFAFAIVAIMALFPVGLRSANESRVETIVTQIARTVLSDLRTGPFTAAKVIVVPLPENTSNPTAAPSANAVIPYNLSLAAGVTQYIAYSSDGTPAYKNKNNTPPPPLRKAITVNYINGTPEADFIVKIESKIISAASTTPLLAQVTVTVEAPAAAPVGNRTKYPVISLMGDTR